jgi:hypothetical protein
MRISEGTGCYGRNAQMGKPDNVENAEKRRRDSDQYNSLRVRSPVTSCQLRIRHLR